MQYITLQWGRNFIVAEICQNVVRYCCSAWLQWGRNFIVAEIRLPWPGTSSGGSASMGPQLYRCGNSLWYTILVYQDLASMGPQLYRCGNVAEIRHLREDIDMLQWGRNFIVAEIRHHARHWNANFGLQWGRNFIVAEMRSRPPEPQADSPASMGPQLYRCGNLSYFIYMKYINSCFNGAATLSLRKFSDVLHGMIRELTASMGPQLYRCGNLQGISCYFRDSCGFNGAATLSLRK